MLIAKSALGAISVVVVVAVLLLTFGSRVSDAMLAVLASVKPSGALRLTCTTTVMVARSPLGMSVSFVHSISCRYGL